MNNLELHRRKKGLTQGELGAKLGVSKQMVSKWENGKLFVDPKHWEKLTETLGVSAEELFNEDPNYKPILRGLPKIDIDGIKDCFPVTWKKRIALIENRREYKKTPTEELKRQIGQLDNEIKNEEVKEFPDYEESHFSIDDNYTISSSSQKMIIAIPDDMATQFSNWLQDNAKTKSISDSTRKQLDLLTSYFLNLNQTDRKAVIKIAFDRAFTRCTMLGLKEMEKERKESKLKELNVDKKIIVIRVRKDENISTLAKTISTVTNGIVEKYGIFDTRKCKEYRKRYWLVSKAFTIFAEIVANAAITITKFVPFLNDPDYKICAFVVNSLKDKECIIKDLEVITKNIAVSDYIEEVYNGSII